MISTTSVRTASHIFFLRYFGMKAIWYWHLHFVCVKLSLSIRTHLLWLFRFVLASQIYYTPKEAFSSRFYATAYSILPNIARGLGQFHYSLTSLPPLRIIAY